MDDARTKDYDEFALQPETTPGEVPPLVIEELCHFRALAKDHASAFGDAVKAQASKYGVNPGALRKYVCALEDDAVEALDAEAEAILKLAAQ